VKKALVEGASWWNQAFEAAGFRNAFQVAVLPDGADPMDIRYNMINWVHRSTRGWSSGGSVSDPRTGEIIKATVTLGSLRDRQDYMIFEGLLSPYEKGNERPAILYETALKRIRQLAAHEVGHTLGLGHNYYDSNKGWISVMDYPHPLEALREDGTIDLSNAYPQHIGDWDKVAINFGYREYAKGTDEAPALTKIIADAWAQDLRYFTNQDTDIHPRTEQWSNGVNQGDELLRLLRVRRAALNRLGEHTIRAGQPTVLIEEPLVPIYMYHRYAVEAASSMIGGQDFTYAMRGDGTTPMEWANGEMQRKAIDALSATLKPSELTIPKKILDLIPPRRRTRARRSRDVAGQFGAKRPGTRNRVVQAAEAGGAPARGGRQDRIGPGAAHADRGRHQAVPRAAGGRSTESDRAIAGAARGTDRRRADGLAGTATQGLGCVRCEMFQGCARCGC